MPFSAERRRTAATVALAAWLAACAGSGEGLDANGRPLGDGDPTTGPLTADFDSIQAHVFTPVCTTCHAGGSAPQGLRLDAASSYDLLVGVPSTQRPGVLRVAPGDPDRSYLVQKLEGTAEVGARMPLGGPYLDPASIDVVRQWIVEGALRSSTGAAATTPFALATSTPAHGAVLAASTVTLVVAFTHELDRTRIGPSTVRLERLAGASAGDGVTEVASDVAVADANPAAIHVRPHAALAPGRYRLRIDTRDVADLAGRRLAGYASAADEPALVTAFEIEATP